MFGLAAIAIAVSAARLALPMSLRGDRALVVAGIVIGGVVMLAAAVPLLAYFFSSTVGSDDGADIGGASIALSAGVVLSSVALIVIGVRANAPIDSIVLVSGWLGVVLCAIGAGISSTDTGLAFRVVFDLVLSGLLMGSAGTVSAVIAASLRTHRARSTSTRPV